MSERVNYPPREPLRRGRKLATDLEPLGTLPKIFDHLARSALREGLDDALHELKDRQLGIATMCSGTESPLLAISMIADALRAYGFELNWKHYFSAEIVPFKQAFIERNFHPDILFRDVTKLEQGEKCETAYGPEAKVPDPGQVQMLVAGFSCVDFSMLNNIRRGLEIDLNQTMPESNGSTKRASGESSATFNAIYKYARDFRPALIILENVNNAPWTDIVGAFGLIKYAAGWSRCDTKNYYLPHTRQRVYMICVNYDSRTSMLTKAKAEQAVIDCINTMEHLSRRASSTVEDFMLDEKSVVLQKALQDMAIVSSRKSRAEIDWSRCIERHALFREEIAVGNGHPYTNWKSGRSIIPDYADSYYHKIQPDRIKDTLDILLLKSVREGWDMEFKSRFPDVSQNVDRNLGGAAPGIVGCITPSGQVYATYRGGPLTGLESLSLQGLPIDKLHLTRETQKDLLDLAGNAMSSTVVGAFMVSAIIAARNAIPPSSRPSNNNTTKAIVLQETESEELEGTPTSYEAKDSTSLSDIMKKAVLSRQFCHCELQTGMTTLALFQCTACGVTTCRRHRHKPVHDFMLKRKHSAEINDDTTINTKEANKTFGPSDRISPGDFERALRRNLPVRLSVDLTRESFVTAAATEEIVGWEAYLSAIDDALGEDFVYESLKRSRVWTVSYTASMMRLDLIIASDSLVWQLYVTPPESAPSDSFIRKQLREPVAIMLLDIQSDDLLGGTWSLRIPKSYDVVVTVSGQGNPVPSYRNELRLPEFVNETVSQILHLDIPDIVPQYIRDTIGGSYKLLPRCGTSNRLLHKKISTNDSTPVFLFQDPDRIDRVENDRMVISLDHHRLQTSDTRIHLAEFGYTSEDAKKLELLPSPSSSAIRGEPDLPYAWRPSGLGQVQVQCSIPFQSRPSTATISVASSKLAKMFVPGPVAVQRLKASTTCTDGGNTVLFCKLPWNGHDPNGLKRGGSWIFRDCDTELTRPYAEWLMWSIPHPLQGSHKDPRAWIPLPSTPKNFTTNLCIECVPPRPKIKWKCTYKNARPVFEPVEDPETNPQFEVAYKARPSPVMLKVDINRSTQPASAYFTLNLNPTALLHRTISMFPRSHFPVGDFTSRWRFNIHVTRNSNPILPAFKFQSTDDELNTVFRFQAHQKTIALRPEQQKELTWMIRQDRSDCPVYIEQTVEEIRCQSLGGALEIKVERPIRARGGVLADDVGFGKTVQTIALVKETKSAAFHEMDHGCPPSLIPSQATIIFAPATLVPQWEEEIYKFWPDCKVVCISNALKHQDVTIEAITEANIVLVPHTIFISQTTMTRFAALAGMPENPSLSNYRQTTSWLQTASSHLRANTALLKDSTDARQWPKFLKTKTEQFEADDTNKAKVPSARLIGEAFQRQLAANRRAISQAEQLGLADVAKHLSKQKISSNDSTMEKKLQTKVKPSKNKSKESIPGFTSPHIYDVSHYILTAFRFHRKVIDEETYLQSADRAAIGLVEANSTWALSATLGLKNFEDVKRIAEVLGIYLGASDISRTYSTDAQINWAVSNMTDAEYFAANMRDSSDQYYEQRHQAAQKFVSHFVRSNRREGDSIACAVNWEPVLPTQLHRLLIIEQTSIFTSDEVKLACKRTQAMLSNPREHRSAHLLRVTASSPQDAMVNGCTYDPTDNGTKATDDTNGQGALQNELEKRCHYYQVAKKTLTESIATLVTSLAPRQVQDSFAQLQALINNQPVGPKDLSLLEVVKSRAAELVAALDPTDLPIPQATAAHTKTLMSEISTNKVIFLEAQGAYRYLANGQSIQDRLNVPSKNGKRFEDCGCKIPPQDAIIVTTCGHTMCTEHHEEFPAQCHIDNCGRPKLNTDVVAGPELGNFRSVATRSKGAKLDKMVDLIMATQEEEQVLVFAQGKAMKEEALEALEQGGISAVIALEGTRGVNSMRDSQAIFTRFRNLAFADAKGTLTKGWKKVMILDPTDSAAAGHNLTNAHVVIFLAPILADDGQQARSYYKQSTGRILRPGQKRECKIHHLFLMDSVDFNIAQDSQEDEYRLDAGRLLSLKKHLVPDWRAKASAAAMAASDKNIVLGDTERLDWGSKQYGLVDWPPRGSAFQTALE